MENKEEAANDAGAIYFIATTDISTYLLRCGKRMINYMLMPLKRGGIDKLYELCLEAELEQDANQIVRIGNVIANFPKKMIEIAGCCDENSNDESVMTKNGLYHPTTGSSIH